QVAVMTNGHAYWFEGVVRCRLSWVCPVCAEQHTRKLRHRVRRAVRKWREGGGHVVMATLTVHHTSCMSIEQVLGLVSGAYERFGKSNGPGRGYNALSERYGIGGRVKSLEITWKPSSGWHVHLHVLLFLNAALTE